MAKQGREPLGQLHENSIARPWSSSNTTPTQTATTPKERIIGREKTPYNSSTFKSHRKRKSTSFAGQASCNTETKTPRISNRAEKTTITKNSSGPHTHSGTTQSTHKHQTLKRSRPNRENYCSTAESKKEDRSNKFAPSRKVSTNYHVSTTKPAAADYSASEPDNHKSQHDDTSSPMSMEVETPEMLDELSDLDHAADQSKQSPLYPTNRTENFQEFAMNQIKAAGASARALNKKQRKKKGSTKRSIKDVSKDSEEHKRKVSPETTKISKQGKPASLLRKPVQKQNHLTPPMEGPTKKQDSTYSHLQQPPQRRVMFTKAKIQELRKHSYSPDDREVFETVNNGPPRPSQNLGPMTGLTIGGRRMKRIDSLDDDEVTIDFDYHDPFAHEPKTKATGIIRGEPKSRHSSHRVPSPPMGVSNQSKIPAPLQHSSPNQSFRCFVTESMFYQGSEPDSSSEDVLQETPLDRREKTAANRFAHAKSKDMLCCPEVWSLPDDEMSVTSKNFIFEIQGKKYYHPALPPGWNLKIDPSHNRPFYHHPDYGFTYYCPVPLPVKPPQTKRMPLSHKEPLGSVTPVQRGFSRSAVRPPHHVRPPPHHQINESTGLHESSQLCREAVSRFQSRQVKFPGISKHPLELDPSQTLDDDYQSDIHSPFSYSSSPEHGASQDSEDFNFDSPRPRTPLGLQKQPPTTPASQKGDNDTIEQGVEANGNEDMEICSQDSGSLFSMESFKADASNKDTGSNHSDDKGEFSNIETSSADSSDRSFPSSTEQEVATLKHQGQTDQEHMTTTSNLSNHTVQSPSDSVNSKTRIHQPRGEHKEEDSDQTTLLEHRDDSTDKSHNAQEDLENTYNNLAAKLPANQDNSHPPGNALDPAKSPEMQDNVDEKKSSTVLSQASTTSDPNDMPIAYDDDESTVLATPEVVDTSRPKGSTLDGSHEVSNTPLPENSPEDQLPKETDNGKRHSPMTPSPKILPGRKAISVDSTKSSRKSIPDNSRDLSESSNSNKSTPSTVATPPDSSREQNEGMPKESAAKTNLSSSKNSDPGKYGNRPIIKTVNIMSHANGNGRKKSRPETTLLPADDNELEETSPGIPVVNLEEVSFPVGGNEEDLLSDLDSMTSDLNSKIGGSGKRRKSTIPAGRLGGCSLSSIEEAESTVSPQMRSVTSRMPHRRCHLQKVERIKKRGSYNHKYSVRPLPLAFLEAPRPKKKKKK